MSALPVSSPQDQFSDEATLTLKELRRATAEVLGGCHGLDRAVDVAHRLGLDRSLAWKVWQVGQGTKGCPSSAHVPGRAGYRRFLDAAGRAGVLPEVIEHARAAYEKFEELTSTYAGDRATAGSMLSGLSEEGRTRMETAIRRDGFRANAHFLGVQAAALYQLDVLLPFVEHEPRRIVRVRGHIGLRRNRPNVAWVISRSTLVHRDGPSPSVSRVSLSGRQVTNGDLPLILPEFCSRPLPPVERRVIAGVTFEDELQPGPVGQVGAVDVVTGERVEWQPRAGTLSDAVTMAVTTPCERLCFDVLVPEAISAAGLSLSVHSTVQTEHPFLHCAAYLIPVPESLEELGPAGLAPSTPEIPRHGEMIRWTLAQAGLFEQPMRLWRLRMRFPPVPSCVAVTYRVGHGEG